MTFKELKKISEPHFYCLYLDRYFPKAVRNFLRRSFALMALISFAFSFDALPLYFGKADSLFFFSIFVYLSLSFLEFFYKSMRGEGLQTRMAESLIQGKGIDYALSEIIFVTDEIDATLALFKSKIGLEVLVRSGIPADSFKNFVYSERQSIIASALNFESDSINLAEYLKAIYEADKSFESFLSHNSINKEEFLGAAAWIMETEEKKRKIERFWSRENLGAIPSIGTSWAYGKTEDLGKYGRLFEDSEDLSLFDIESGYREREVAALESILVRSEEANAIIIDDDEKVARDIVSRLLKKIRLGVSLPPIEHKNIIELDSNALIASYKNKSELESEFLKILNEATAAGNIIIYISDLAGFLGSAKNIGTNLSSLLSPYLSSKNLQIIASTTTTDFHFFIEQSSALLEKFERIIPDSAGVDASISIVLEQIPNIEKRYGIFFSYPAVLALVNSADRFITYGEMPGKALDMLAEIAPWAADRKISMLRENDVSIFISEKTGITTGAIGEKEAQKIEHLEELLHKRVVGQNEAVSGIASAIRRARSGIGNPKKPLASFLFVGPTGVGKTEVSKALAESFFGGENKMIRFDMSEYNGPEALPQLIGDFAANKSGLLASRVRDNPYSVLLLDEFEKASPDVLDLFLQILDEGIFTDALGRQVNCRNLIIIATSNAGSSLIWESIRSGNSLAGSKDIIINSIIREKIFKPELLNRFDGIIFFHPLHKSELESVARLGLKKLA
ncbi:AAA family ATPase, partial [Patescibacteria group bacterium]|nr:AAA family ATPase [Patescibacteria group bacterium]